ncbi:uncharacterized protein LAESUDRAFT_750532 [Laetiporus sulphureus 93-53]|uniref:Uncharacterized protein n=1 Tax=Laetiporus sulphureus 93-53 TaxID=1314785 RepID=A0A165DTM5_9APHY|nr:uncharacterized protein LAESUDRAFT_750532 [Laetiporus sulphureus 93-53]KZT05610.1 hypothetical protein LAESUDRAFT_750532 [Laetiporus sulphureus 93-53]
MVGTTTTVAQYATLGNAGQVGVFFVASCGLGLLIVACFLMSNTKLVFEAQRYANVPSYSGRTIRTLGRQDLRRVTQAYQFASFFGPERSFFTERISYLATGDMKAGHRNRQDYLHFDSHIIFSHKAVQKERARSVKSRSLPHLARFCISRMLRLSSWEVGATEDPFAVKPSRFLAPDWPRHAFLPRLCLAWRYVRLVPSYPRFSSLWLRSR